MTLLFTLRPSYGHERYYPINAAAQALMRVVGRKCIEAADLAVLEAGGFTVNVTIDGADQARRIK